MSIFNKSYNELNKTDLMSCKQTASYNSFYHNHLYQLAGLSLQQINTHGEITHGVHAFWPLHTQFLILKKVPLFQQS